MGSKKQFRVLLVDDNPFDVELMEMTLKAGLNCSIVKVDTESEFLIELGRALPDVIVSDSNIPRFDGAAALALVRELCPQVPFVFCTGAVPEAIKVKGLALGAAAWLSKDNLEEFVAAVRNICGADNE